MIGALRGTVLDVDPEGALIVEVGGVGYDVSVTGPTLHSVGAVGQQVSLRVHTRVREESITLYGFVSIEEKSCFETLLSAHGVGPSMALALLSMHTPSTLRQIAATEDAEALARVPGIGKKTATRLLVELRAKLDVEGAFGDIVNVVTIPAGGDAADPATQVRADVVSALSALGYEGTEIRKVLPSLPSDGTVEQLVRHALRELATAS